ncbi:helix-turn-helix transcriptional regulator [Daejeonella sp.]|jgi:transcriptional regulator with XRE-family HTH domain|uniref:helix-turn-helix transcriptional regulator n=1 Tax=Daejeonella sp. TaxID=2805397 RepID=UPI003783C7E9
MKREIGNIIQTFRISCGFKQVYMAYNLGISTQAYANLEHGRSDLKSAKLQLIANLLGIRPYQIRGVKTAW